MTIKTGEGIFKLRNGKKKELKRIDKLVFHVSVKNNIESKIITVNIKAYH